MGGGPPDPSSFGRADAAGSGSCRRAHRREGAKRRTRRSIRDDAVGGDGAPSAVLFEDSTRPALGDGLAEPAHRAGGRAGAGWVVCCALRALVTVAARARSSALGARGVVEEAAQCAAAGLLLCRAPRVLGALLPAAGGAKARGWLAGGRAGAAADPCRRRRRGGRSAEARLRTEARRGSHWYCRASRASRGRGACGGHGVSGGYGAWVRFRRRGAHRAGPLGVTRQVLCLGRRGGRGGEQGGCRGGGSRGCGRARFDGGGGPRALRRPVPW